MFFPLMLAAVYSSQFAKATDLPAFPYDDITFLDFILPARSCRAWLFGSIGGAAIWPSTSRTASSTACSPHRSPGR
jgi:hypothetical protein